MPLSKTDNLPSCNYHFTIQFSSFLIFVQCTIVKYSMFKFQIASQLFEEFKVVSAIFFFLFTRCHPLFNSLLCELRRERDSTIPHYQHTLIPTLAWFLKLIAIYIFHSITERNLCDHGNTAEGAACKAELIAEAGEPAQGSVADPYPPDPHVFGPPGSGPTSQRYGSGSFYHHAKIVRKTFIL